MPDQIIREIPLIQRYAHGNEDDDFRFRTFLKGKLSLSNKQLDAVVAQTTEEVWAQIDCTTCGNCCKTLQIMVDNRDIKRLAAKLGVSVRQFSQQYVGIADDQSKYFLSTPCVFLSADNRCTVYEDRPQACRDFPYVHEHNFRSRTLSMIDNTATCPIVFNVWQQLKGRVGYRPRATRARDRKSDSAR